MSGTAPTPWYAGLLKIIAPLKTSVAALVTAAVPLITQGGFPTTLGGWLGLLASAAVGAGLLHITAPRNS